MAPAQLFKKNFFEKLVDRGARLAAARSGQALKVHWTFIHSLPLASQAPATTTPTSFR